MLGNATTAIFEARDHRLFSDMTNNAHSQSGDAAGRPPTRKLVLPQPRPTNGHATLQYTVEQYSLVANGTSANTQSKVHCSTKGNNGMINSTSKQRRDTCHCSWRDRVMFAFGFSLALVILWCGRSFYENSEDDDHLSVNIMDVPIDITLKDGSAGKNGSADAVHLRDSQISQTLQKISTVNTGGSKSDKDLLEPLLGSSYKQFLSLRLSRFKDIRTNDPEKCRHLEFYDVDYTYHNLTAGSFAQIWTDEKVRSHFKWKKKAAAKDYKKSFEKTRAKYLTPTGWDEKAERWNAADVIVGSNHTRIFVNATDKSTKHSKAALKALKTKPKPRSITFLHVGKAGGSSVSCNINASFKFGKRHCPGYEHGNKLKYAYDAHNDSAISQQVS